MLIVMHHWAAERDIEAVKKTIARLGFRPVAIPGAERTAIGVIGNQGWVEDSAFRGIKAIMEIIHVTKPYKLVSRDFHPADTVVKLSGELKIGGKSPFAVIAGPCAIEVSFSVFTITTLTRPARLRARSSTAGIIPRQCAHHGAQKKTSTRPGDSKTSESKLAVVPSTGARGKSRYVLHFPHIGLSVSLSTGTRLTVLQALHLKSVVLVLIVFFYKD